MYIGIFMLLLGVYEIASEYYDVQKLLKTRVLVRRETIDKDEYFKIKFVLGIFSIVIGILYLLNYLRF